jgi:hypothetical protein
MDRVRLELLPEIYGPSTSQITGPVASNGVGELSGQWIAVSQEWVDAVLLELPVLSFIDIRMAITEIDREVFRGGRGAKVGSPSGLTWRRYGRGLQVDAETALKARLVKLAEESATRIREAESRCQSTIDPEARTSRLRRPQHARPS